MKLTRIRRQTKTEGPSDPDVTDSPRLRGSTAPRNRLIPNCPHFPVPVSELVILELQMRCYFALLPRAPKPTPPRLGLDRAHGVWLDLLRVGSRKGRRVVPP